MWFRIASTSLPRPDFADHLHLAVDEIEHYGRDSARIMARVRGMLLDLLRVAPPFRRPILHEVVLSLPEVADDRRVEPQPPH